jgi:plastocyanin
MKVAIKSFIENGGFVSVSVGTTLTFTVGNSGSSHYVFTGNDRTTGHTNALDPTINCNAQDILVFNVNASGHPFYIKTNASTGTGNQVTTGTITGNGAAVGTVTWDTTGVTPGTYYYICQYHGGMVGQIVVS